ncbi:MULTISPECIES: peptidylprolyl isomerase [unclassified Kitasatospora]|uniref:peptidylprolyl isomerase n=1 Tax=unclassified Kitasatospora TaxID=2633591 RepID=UPI002E334057|nr:peptidylprolyl isomerase [Kitasatospora sp. NBC_01246]
MADAKNAVIHTSHGAITVELFPNQAPKTVRNFVELAEGTREGATDPRTDEPISGPYYDGTPVHRIIDGFMIQAGDPTGTGRGGPGYTFGDERYPDLVFDKPYLLAMANSGPGTNGSQFFITLGPAAWLNFKHTIFGKVADAASEKVVAELGSVATDANDRPLEAVTIDRIEIKR